MSFLGIPCFFKSEIVIAPNRPVPWMWEYSSPCSSATFLARGVILISAGAAFSGTGDAAAACSALSAKAPPSLWLPPHSADISSSAVSARTAMASPQAASSPSGSRILRRIPSLGASHVLVILSVVISARALPFVTEAPSSTSQEPRTPVSIDNPNLGIITFVTICISSQSPLVAIFNIPSIPGRFLPDHPAAAVRNPPAPARTVPGNPGR